MAHPSSTRTASVDHDPFGGGAIRRVVPTTDSQREVWLADQFGRDASLAFNESVSLRLRGLLDESALTVAIAALYARRDALRAVFGPDGETLCVREAATLPLARVDLSALPAEEAGARLIEQQKAAVDTPFDLLHGPLFRAQLLRLAHDDHVLLLTAHHIVCDGWSWWLIVRELSTLYAAHRDGTGSALPAAAQFADYALAQALRGRHDARRYDERYWLDQYAEPPPVLDLPLDRQRPTRRSYASAREDYVLDASIVAVLRRTGARNGASLFAVLLAGFATLLGRLAGQDDVVVAIPAAGQSIDDNGDVVGHCVNALPLRFRLDMGNTALAAIGQAQAQLLDAIEHQRYTYGELLKKLTIARDAARPPLVSVMFNIDQALDHESAAFPGLALEFSSNPRSHENFELFINAVQEKGEIRLECQYNRDLFAPATIRRWLGCFATLLRAVAARPETALAELDWLDPVERAALSELQPEATAYDRQCLMHQHFERQCGATPARFALSTESGEFSYAQLEARANRIAHALRRRGIRRGALVGLALDRSVDMVAAWLAILKSGAGYVPLDPAFPLDRLAYMVGDAGLAALVTLNDLRGRFDLRGRPVLILDEMTDELNALPDTPLPIDANGADPESIAYVIYTSGSTGKPKGVAIPHRAVANFIHAMREAPGMGADDVLVAVTTLSFDIAVLELLLPLSVGARVVLASREAAIDGISLAQTLAQHRASVMQATPATWRLLLEAGWQGDASFTILCGGEPLPPDLAALLLARCGRLWNLYGPTETTIWSSAAQLTAPIAGGQPDTHIGRPIANTRIWILDARGQPCPRGVPGEICIGGDGVAIGYLHRPELTAERFVTDPFCADARLYRSGDRGRWREDGNLAHLGRLDHQLKLRGHRIEPGEIENALRAAPDVTDAVVVVREDRPGDARLVAYLVARPGTRIDERALGQRLRGSLPDYMVPQHLLCLPALPRLPNGKLDRAALPAPNAHDGGGKASAVPARDATEASVVAAMAAVLGAASVGIHDDFFALGGHSLLAAQLTARLNRELGATLSLRAVFDHPTAAGLAAQIRGSAPATRTQIERRDDQHRAPLTIMQERMRLLDAFNPGQLGYNIPSAHRLRGALDVAALDRALHALAQRQTVLRTSIVIEDGASVQRIHEQVEFGLLDVEDLSLLPPGEREPTLARRMSAMIEQPFANLAEPPLVRVRLFRIEAAEHVLFFMAHHIIWDGWSFDLLYSELAELYAAEIERRPARLPELAVTYGDFACWHGSFLVSRDYAGQLDWWRRTLGRRGPDPGGVPQVLPTDMPRMRGLPDRGEAVEIEVAESLTQTLVDLSRDIGTTMFNTLLGAYCIALSAYAGNRDLVVGTLVRGRNSAEVENLMGYFTNLLPLRVDVDPDIRFRDFAQTVREAALQAFDHPDVLIDDLDGAMHIAGQESALRYHALFSYQDVRQRPTQWANLEHSRVEVSQPGATGELGLWFVAHRHGLTGGLIFNASLFRAATMRGVIAAFKGVLEQLASRPDASMRSLLQVAHAVLTESGTTPASSGNPVATDVAPQAIAAPIRPSAHASQVAYLIAAWAEVLGREGIAEGDNFFDLGGNSMQAALMAARVFRDTGYQIRLLRLASHSLAQIAREIGDDAADRGLGRPDGALHFDSGSAFAALPPGHQVAFLDADERRLCTVVSTPAADARGALLICPPFLQEHARSYGLFALLARALAARGIAVVRFDYHGTGDSSGESTDFGIASADRDAATVFDAMRHRYSGCEAAVLGVSAGALIAAPLAFSRDCRLALWRPALDGTAWFDELVRLDAIERGSTRRFPFLRAGDRVVGDGNDLMGFRLPPAFAGDVCARRVSPEAVRNGVLLDANRPATVSPDAFIELPEPLYAWTGQIDIREYFRMADVDAVAASLASSLGWGGA